jgi:hypothetical protein
MLNPVFFQRLAFVLVALMFLALFRGWPREFYSFLRYSICLGSLLLVAIPPAALANKPYWIAGLLIFALLFNPIQKPKFKRSAWQFINAVGLGFYGVLGLKIRQERD